MKTNKKMTNTFKQNSSVFAVFKTHQLKQKESEQLKSRCGKITATRITTPQNATQIPVRQKACKNVKLHPHEHTYTHPILIRTQTV